MLACVIPLLVCLMCLMIRLNSCNGEERAAVEGLPHACMQHGVLAACCAVLRPDAMQHGNLPVCVWMSDWMYSGCLPCMHVMVARCEFA